MLITDEMLNNKDRQFNSGKHKHIKKEDIDDISNN